MICYRRCNQVQARADVDQWCPTELKSATLTGFRPVFFWEGGIDCKLNVVLLQDEVAISKVKGHPQGDAISVWHQWEVIGSAFASFSFIRILNKHNGSSCPVFEGNQSWNEASEPGHFLIKEPLKGGEM